MNPETTSRGVTAAALCPVCQESFAPTRRQRYCGKRCRDTAYRRRHRLTPPSVSLPAAGSRRRVTVYECEGCGTRSLGVQQCDGCKAFMRRLGFGGLCPHCDEPVAIRDLIDEEVMSRGS